MKIIFLDIDGVLNTDPYLEIHGRYVDGEGRIRNTWPEGHVDPEKVALLNEICGRSGAQVVLSSTWRLYLTIEDMTGILRKKGYNGPDIFDRTPEFRRPPRREEISAWLKAHEDDVAEFVVIDDQEDAVIDGHTISTDEDIGLLPEHVEEALAILEAV